MRMSGSVPPPRLELTVGAAPNRAPKPRPKPRDSPAITAIALQIFLIAEWAPPHRLPKGME